MDSKDEVLVFSNGRAFVSLNPETSETKVLASTALPYVSKLLLDPNRNGALFQTYNHTSNDTLSAQLSTLNLPFNQAYWWYVDFTSKTFQLIINSQAKPATFTTAQWLTDGSGFVASDNANITIYNQDLSIKKSYGYPQPINNIVATKDNKLRTVSNNKLIENDLGSAENPTTLLDNVTGAAFSPDGSWAYISQGTEKQEEVPVALYNFVDKKKYFETTAHEPAPTWSKDGTTLYIPSDENRGENFTLIKAISIKDMREHYIESRGPKIGFKHVNFAMDDKTFIGEVDSDESFYLATHNQVTGMDVTGFKTTDFDDNKSKLEYFSNQYGYFITTLYGTDSAENREKPIKILREQGINPDLVQIMYSFYENNKGAGL